MNSSDRGRLIIAILSGGAFSSPNYSKSTAKAIFKVYNFELKYLSSQVSSYN